MTEPNRPADQSPPPQPRLKRHDNAIIQATLVVTGGQFAFNICGYSGLPEESLLVLEKVMINDRDEALLNVGIDSIPVTDAAEYAREFLSRPRPPVS
jgi:hypothetical protein